MVFIGVDLDQIDKMAPRRVKSAPGFIGLNQHFGAETDLLDLECGVPGGGKMGSRACIRVS